MLIFEFEQSFTTVTHWLWDIFSSYLIKNICWAGTEIWSWSGTKGLNTGIFCIWLDQVDVICNYAWFVTVELSLRD